VEILLAPLRVSQTLWLKSFSPQALPERIHIRQVEDYPSPPLNRMIFYEGMLFRQRVKTVTHVVELLSFVQDRAGITRL
jgi:hypothetical protein